VIFVEDRCYSATSVWRLAHLPRAYVMEALETGRLRAIRTGKGWKVPGSAVREFLEGLGRSDAA
jgi:excisionase family DNA binding protein